MRWSNRQRDGTFGGLLSDVAFQDLTPVPLRAWWRLLRDPGPEAVIAVCPSILAVLAVRISLSRRVRRLALVHDLQSGLATSLGLTQRPAIGAMLRALEHAALQPMARIVTLSEAMAHAIRTLRVTTPISIIPPTVDDQLIQPLPEPSGPIRLLYSGNLGRKQGLEQLIDLAAELKRRGNPANLIIRGDGNHRAALQQRAASLALNNLRFEPLYPARRLAEGHIHLVPQNPAGATFAVPSKIYSIMAAGRRFICTAEPCSTLEQQRADSDAFVICPPNQPGQFADAIERLIAEPAKRARLARHARVYVVQHAGRAAAAWAYRDSVTVPLPFDV